MKMFLHNAEDFVSHNDVQATEVLRRLGVHLLEHPSHVPLDPSTFDAVFIRASDEDDQSTYLIALALAKQKPVLYFIEQGRRPPSAIRQLQEHELFRRLLRIIPFTKKSLERDIAKAVHGIEDGTLAEVPTIKFTLRVTPSMERYLQWKSKKTGLSKADFLRQVVQEEIIDKDQEYLES